MNIAFHIGNYLKVFDIYRCSDINKIKESNQEIKEEIMSLVCRSYVGLEERVNEDLKEEVENDKELS